MRFALGGILLSILMATAATANGVLLPDLAVTKVARSPPEPHQGQNVTFTAFVKNNAGRSAPTQVNFSVDGEAHGSVFVPALGMRAPLMLHSGPWNAAVAGSHEVRAVVDPSSQQLETNEANNTRTDDFTVWEGWVVTDAAEFEVLSLTRAPAQADVGDAVRFTATVRRVGYDVQRPAPVTFLLDGDVFHETTLNLSYGQATPVETPPWTAAAGSHTVIAMIFADEGDMDSTDNDEWLTFAVGSVTPTPPPTPSPTGGSTATVTDSAPPTSSGNGTPGAGGIGVALAGFLALAVLRRR